MYLTICTHCGSVVKSTSHRCSACGKKRGIFSRDTSWIMRMICLGIICAAVLTYIQTQYNNYIYASYRPAQCLIQDKSILVTKNTTKNGTTTKYIPYLTYDVLTATGQHAISHNYTGPVHVSFDARSDAQSISDIYQFNTMYDCWYSAVKMDGALVLQSDTGTRAVGGIFAYGALFILIFIILYRNIYRPWRLIKKGITVYGKVIRHEKRSTKTGSYTVSIIAFDTVTDPPLTYEGIKHSDVKKDKKCSIVYDPLYPQYNVVGEEFTSRIGIFFRCIGVILLFCLVALVALFLF